MSAADKAELYLKTPLRWTLPGMDLLWRLRHGGPDALPMAKGVLGSKMLSFPEALEEALDCFVPEADEAECARLRREIIGAGIRNLITPAEYFIFGFDGLPRSKRKEYVSRFEKDIYMVHYLGLGENYQLLHDKYRFYQRFAEFFHRDMCEFYAGRENKAFDAFCRTHRSYIAKNKTGRMGVGTVIREFDGTEDAIQREAEFLSEAGESWVIEELIVQDDRMGILHPASVNTVRICTRWTGGDIHVLEAFVRCGQGGSVVDNICSGGLSAQIDPGSGAIISDAIDHLGHVFPVHPTSNVRFKEFQIPCWDQLLNVVRAANAMLPAYPYIGWDLAFSAADGWVLVEGNWANFITQYLKKGIRKEFLACFKGLEPKK